MTRTPIHYKHNPLIVLEKDQTADSTFPHERPVDRYIDTHRDLGMGSDKLWPYPISALNSLYIDRFIVITSDRDRYSEELNQ